jgi:hypothetical protein
MEDRMESQGLFEHPEIKDLLKDLLSGLVAESDRGAVLVGNAYVDEYLERLFNAIIPSGLGKKRRRELLKHPGPLSTFSAKVEIAYIARLITRSLYDSIHALRGLRNELAHEPKSFRLRDHMDRIRQMYELGPGTPVAINRMALDVMMYLKVQTALDLKHPTEDKPCFTTYQEVVEFMADSPQIIETLEEQLPRYELAMAIALICALLVWFREAATRVLANDLILASLDAPSGQSRESNAEEQGSKGTEETGVEIPANPGLQRTETA